MITMLLRDFAAFILLFILAIGAVYLAAVGKLEAA
jgi:hypothetical protein